MESTEFEIMLTREEIAALLAGEKVFVSNEPEDGTVTIIFLNPKEVIKEAD